MTTEIEDIEIYVEDLEFDTCLEWLQEVFSEVSQVSTHKRSLRCLATFENVEIPVQVLLNSNKSFSSIWFKHAQTPWKSDQACARVAFSHFNRTVRCTAGSWQPDQDPDLWWQISTSGEEEILWKD